VKQYICSICGFVYEESTGFPDGGIAAGTKWEDVPDDWACPLCGADKTDFQEELSEAPSSPAEPAVSEMSTDEMRELSFGETSALCSSLSKGCTQQNLIEEAGLFNELSEYYASKAEPVAEEQLTDLLALIQEDLDTGYPTAKETAGEDADRGALRALTWGEKVTRILSSLIKKYETKQAELLENTNIYLCESCGFIFIGNEAPEICPVCKVPKTKLTKV
jgi:rubredoxin